jgi:hypothetical protein
VCGNFGKKFRLLWKDVLSLNSDIRTKRFFAFSAIVCKHILLLKRGLNTEVFRVRKDIIYGMELKQSETRSQELKKPSNSLHLELKFFYK